MMTGGDVYFTDLPKHILGGFKSAEGIGVGWIPFDYELDDFAGTGLATGALSQAGELVLDLNLTGWHILHFCHTPTLRLWFDGEKGFRELDTVQSSLIRDYPMHAADLTGRKLHIAPKHGTHPRHAILFYIRAEPCAGPRPGKRNLIATEDGHGVFWGGTDSSRELYKWLYPYRDSDFFRVLWGVYGGGDLSANPASRTATVVPGDLTHAVYPQERTFADSIRKIVDGGDDPLAVAVAAAREVGIQIHFYFRVGAFHAPFPHFGGSRFYLEHPALRCRDEFGNEVKRLSFAFPEVQDHLMDYFDELMDYEPDGLCLAFNRGLPVMACEEPVLAEFNRRHGRPPRLPDEVDSEEMLTVRHELLAGFMDRVSRRLEKRGRALSCIVPRNFGENRRRGLDIEMLVKRGLFESVMVGAGHEDNDAFTTQHNQPRVDPDNLEPVRKLKAFGTAKIFVGGCSGHGTYFSRRDPYPGAERMRNVLDAGLDGGYFWDANQWFAQHWDVMRHYGDRAFLDDLLNGRIPAPVYRKTKRIHDVVNDRYSPWNAC
jgi:hypothetical protein